MTKNQNSINKTAEIFITLLNEIFLFIDLFIIVFDISNEQVVDISNGQYFP